MIITSPHCAVHIDTDPENHAAGQDQLIAAPTHRGNSTTLADFSNNPADRSTPPGSSSRLRRFVVFQFTAALSFLHVAWTLKEVTTSSGGGSQKRIPGISIATALLVTICAPIGTVRAMETYKTTIALAIGTCPLEVEYEPFMTRSWAQHVAETTKRFLPAMERYTGVNLAIKDRVRIIAENVVREDDRKSPRYGQKIGGKNNNGIVRIQFDMNPVGDPALLTHELGHSFFLGKLPWVSEGVVSLAPLLLFEWGSDAFSQAEIEAVKAHWRHNSTLPGDVRPADAYPKSEAESSFFYYKYYKTQYLIYRELGVEGYRKFLGEYCKVQATAGLKEFLSLLNSVKPMDWQTFLAGWCLPMPYQKISMADFADSDGDGLVDVDEHYGGTDRNNWDTDGDQLPDGIERQLARGEHTDPCVPEAEIRAMELMEKFGPFVDGRDSEWQRLGCWAVPSARSSANSPSGAMSGYEIESVNSCINGGRICFAIRTKGKPGIAGNCGLNPDHAFFMQVRRTGKRDADFMYAFHLTKPQTPWRYDVARGNGRQVNGLATSIGEIIELSIPISDLGPDPCEAMFNFCSMTPPKKGFGFTPWVSISLTPP